MTYLPEGGGGHHWVLTGEDGRRHFVTVRLFRNPHRDTPDTRQWWQGLPPLLEQLPQRLDLLG